MKRLIAAVFSLINACVPKDPRRVVFCSFPDYSDNARAVYEELMRKQAYTKYRLVWLFHAHEVISSVLRRPEGNVCALQRVKSALEMGGRYFGYVAAYEHAFAVAHREN